VRTAWRVMFLTVTAAAVGMELWAAFDGNDSTRPWTVEIVEHVPMEVTLAAIGALVLWLPVHFWRQYARKRRSERRTDVRE